MQSLAALPKKGVYTLIISLRNGTNLQINRKKSHTLQKGLYAYTGSALGKGAVSIRKRVERHLKKKKTKHWHIDYLLADRKARVVAVIAAETGVSQECKVNKLIEAIPETTVPILGFGASDCRHGCGSHLIYGGEQNLQDRVAEAYSRVFKPHLISNLTLISNQVQDEG